MEPKPPYMTRRFASYEKILAIGFGLLAVISPLYIDRRRVESEFEGGEQSMKPLYWLPLLPLLLIIAIGLSLHSDWSFSRTTRFSSHEKLVAICLGILGVLSPLYINRSPDFDIEGEEQAMNFASLLPLLLLLLILAIALSLYLDRSLTRFDPNWIHRVGGSSGGIIAILAILALVLKFKASN